MAEDDLFNPDDHNADDVKAHLATADPDEFARVMEAEKAGKARKGVLDFTQSSDNPPAPSDDGYTRVVVDY
jgi:hypothetical protein